MNNLIKYILKLTKRFLPQRTIRTELMIAILISALIPAGIINIFYFYKINHFIEDKVKTYNNEIVKQSGQKMEFLLTQIQVAQSQLISTSIISESFRKYEDTSLLEKLRIYKDTENLLNDIKRAYSNKIEIYLIGFDGQVYSTNRVCAKSKILQKDWIKSLNDKTYGEMTIPTHEADYFNINDEDDKPEVVSFIRKITQIGDNNTIAVIQIDLNYNEIEGIMNDVDIGENGELWIIKGKDELIYSSKTSSVAPINGRKLPPDKLELIKNTYDYRDKLIIDYKIRNTDWRVVALISNKGVFIQLNELNSMYVLIILISIAFSLFLSYILAAGLTKPITKLVKSMKKVSGGEFMATIIRTKNKDLLVLTSNFNFMVTRIDYLMKNIVEKERDNINAHLKALQAQINPHFLYNTLEVVRSIALDYGAESIAEISKSLAKMFRYNISKDKEIVTIEEEIEHIKNYIRIQKYRFGDKLEIVFDIRQDMYDLKTIKFILQPLVENAIFHGTEQKMGNGSILIRGTRSENLMDIQVIDNGLGMTLEKADEINHALSINALEINREEKHSSIGIGILNVNSRIKLYYGEEYGLSVKSIKNEGTTVYITIPVK